MKCGSADHVLDKLKQVQVLGQGCHRTPSQGGAQEFCTGKHENVR